MKLTLAIIMGVAIACNAHADKWTQVNSPAPGITYPNDLVANNPREVSEQLDWDNDWYIDRTVEEARFDEEK